MRWLVLVGLSFAGCDNPCQRLCVNMAELASSCGISVSDAEIDACIDDQADVSGEDRGVCRESGNPAALEAQWTCDDVALYFR